MNIMIMKYSYSIILRKVFLMTTIMNNNYINKCNNMLAYLLHLEASEPK